MFLYSYLMLHEKNMSSRERTKVQQAVSASTITVSVLSEQDSVLFRENSLIRAYHPVECVLNLRIPQILAKLFVPLALHLAVTA